MVQYIIVGLIVLAALVFVIRTAFKTVKGKKGGGCACANSGSCASERTISCHPKR